MGLNRKLIYLTYLPMLKKSFVSLSFSARRLQILKLTGNKTAVEKFTSVELPEGLIQNYRVKDKKSLADILAQNWQDYKFTEKSVAIVIPEFSAFTKSLVLPDLKAKELDEAVRWQSRDFLPSEYREVIMDWKVVKKEKGENRILAVAIQKEVILDYVDTVAQAGLSPLAIETPSLALERITDGSNEGKLIIYTNFGEAILVMVQGKEIFGSSVVSSADAKGIIWTAVQMIRHYQNIKIKKIEVGGLEITGELLEQLGAGTKLPIEWIKANVAGISAEQIQEYLIPISLQYKDPAEPMNETTVNLLPPKWVKLYHHKRLKVQVWSLSLIASLVIWGCFLAVLGVYLLLDRQIKIFESVQSMSLPEAVINQIDEINLIVRKTSKIRSISYLPQEIIEEVNSLSPPGITLTGYQLDFGTGRIILKGKAINREKLIEFKKVLAENKNYTEISIPISNLEAETDLDFELRCIYGPAAGKKPATIQIK